MDNRTTNSALLVTLRLLQRGHSFEFDPIKEIWPTVGRGWALFCETTDYTTCHLGTPRLKGDTSSILT